MTWDDILKPLYPALAGLLTLVLSQLILMAKEWIRQKVACTKHGQKAAIVADALFAGLRKLGPMAAQMLSDGRLSEAEKLQLKTEARKIAVARMKELRGVVLDESMTWLEHELDVQLGKLEARLFGLPEDGQTIGPDDPAS